MLSRGKRMVLSVLQSAEQENNASRKENKHIFSEYSDDESEPEQYRGKYILYNLNFRFRIRVKCSSWHSD